MEHVIIGDLHGKNCWKEINIDAFDKVVFLGDYADHWDLPDDKIYRNLLNVINLKQEHPDKVELLLGNHDVQYLHYPHFLCSGFRPKMQRSLTDLFTIAYQINDHLFTHAGITNAWYTEFLSLSLVQKIKDDGDTVADLVNKTEQTNQ
jgi:3',5'-cyclic AMP phosphodiesterase CpdA